MGRAEADDTIINAGPVPIGLSVPGADMLRLRVGLRDEASPASYLPAAGRTRPPTSAKGASLDAGRIGVAAAKEQTGLIFSDGSGKALIRLAEVELEPRLRLRFEITGEQHFYGLGEGGQQFDRLGGARRLWNYQANRGQGSDMAVPLLVSQAGYAIFFDNAAGAYVQGSEGGDGSWFEYTSEPGGLDLYVIGGADLKSVMGGVAELLGHATMPPRWALGYLQSSRHFDSKDELLGLAGQFREKHLPCDGLIFLSTYGSAKGWNKGVGHLEFEPGLFDDPAAILGEFKRRHFRVVSHEYPVLHEASPLYAEAARNGYLLEHGYPVNPPGRPRATNFKEGQRYLDFSRPEVRSWWWRAHRELVELGVEGWWLDGGEGPPPEVKLAAGPASVLHNRFDLLRHQAFAEGEAQDRPKLRPYLLCRSGGPGMQRFGAMPWSGDINTTFETMEAQIRIGLNTGMSGVPHWGTDIGGFYRVAPDEGELFARWFQFGAFNSVFRGHGFVWRYHLPWSHGEKIETICRRYLELRYRLMPYTYTLAWQAHRQGLPLMRPLVLNYPDDPRSWDLGTQYLWGDDLLVAPVTRAGATQWPVYLPKGAWHDFWTGERHEGPANVSVEAPLDRLPLFVRAGAIVPFGPVMQYDGEREADAITLLVYPEGSSSFTLYEDDGSTNDYLEGRSARTTFTCAADAKGLSCAVAEPEGHPSLIPAKRSYTFEIHAERRPRSVEIDDRGALAEGQPTGGAGWWYDERFVHVRLAGRSGKARIVW